MKKDFKYDLLLKKVRFSSIEQILLFSKKRQIYSCEKGKKSYSHENMKKLFPITLITSTSTFFSEQKDFNP